MNGSSVEMGVSLPSDRTVAEACQRWVEQRASEMLWTRMGSERNLTESQLRFEVWRSPEGRALARLMGSPTGSLSLDRLKLGPDDPHAEGLRILASGLGGDAA